MKAMEKAEGGSSIPVKVVSRDQDTEPGYWMVEVGTQRLRVGRGLGFRV